MVYCLCQLWTDNSRTETRDDDNQLVRVETNNSMRVVHLCLIPITGFSINLASNHCVISLQDYTEHFQSTGTTQAICIPELSICTTMVHDFCVPFPMPMIHYSQHFFRFQLLSSRFFPLYPILIDQILQRAVGRL